MAKIIRRGLWVLVFILALSALYIGYAHPDWMVDPTLPKASAAACQDKCAIPPDPNRPYFDQWGNKYDYQGNLISTGSCAGDPVDGSNPKCPAQLTTPAPAIDNQIVNQSFQGK